MNQDVIDVVFPYRNEQEFFALARKLGYTELVCVYPSLAAAPTAQPPQGLRVRTAVLAEPRKAWQLRSNGVITFVRCSDHDRVVLEQGAADVLFGAEGTQPKDYAHQRGSGLNHVMALLAAKNKTAIGFSLASILAVTGSARARLLGRMMQNIVLCRKYKVATVIGSFATEPWKMRSPHDLQSLFACLGMHPLDARKSMQGF